MLRELNRPVDEIVRTEGLEGLQRLYGPLVGERIVRGREAECMQHYRRPLQRTEPRTKIQNGFSL